MLQEVLAHTSVQLPGEAQEGLMEDLPVLEVGVFLTSPEEHGLGEERRWEQVEFTWEEEQSILGKLDSPGANGPLLHLGLGLN